MPVPNLKTAMEGPMMEVERAILGDATKIEHWLRLEWQEHTPPFYSSVDLRNAGFKVAPVDTNLYPGGFNNLSAEMLPLAVQAAQSAIEKYCADARNLLLIPENHTRNLFYLQNVARLQTILTQTGLTVRLGSLNPELKEPTRFELPDGSAITVEPLVRNGARLGLAGFDPCAILLNNDLSSGIPDILRTSVQKGQVVGSEKVQNRDLLHLRGEVSGEKLNPLIGGTLKAELMYPVELWIDDATQLVRQPHTRCHRQQHGCKAAQVVAGGGLGGF